MDCNEQCSSNAKEAPDPNHVFEIRVISAQFLTAHDTFQKCKNNWVIKFLAF